MLELREVSVVTARSGEENRLLEGAQRALRTGTAARGGRPFRLRQKHAAEGDRRYAPAA